MSFPRIGFAAWAPTLLFLLAPPPASAVIPTVQWSRDAMLTTWSAVCTAFGRRMRGMASMSSTRSKSL